MCELHVIGEITTIKPTSLVFGNVNTGINVTSRNSYLNYNYNTYIFVNVRGSKNSKILQKLKIGTMIEFTGLLYSYKNKNTDKWEHSVITNEFTTISESGEVDFDIEIDDLLPPDYEYHGEDTIEIETINDELQSCEEDLSIEVIDGEVHLYSPTTIDDLPKLNLHDLPF